MKKPQVISAQAQNRRGPMRYIVSVSLAKATVFTSRKIAAIQALCQDISSGLMMLWIEEDVQNTNTEENGDTQLLLPIHPEAPDNSLGQQEHSNVRHNLDAGRREHHIRQVVAFTREIEFPDGFVRATLHVQKYHTKKTPETLKGYDGRAAPPERISGFLTGNEDSTPVQQDS